MHVPCTHLAHTLHTPCTRPLQTPSAHPAMGVAGADGGGIRAALAPLRAHVRLPVLPAHLLLGALRLHVRVAHAPRHGQSGPGSRPSTHTQVGPSAAPHAQPSRSGRLLSLGPRAVARRPSPRRSAIATDAAAALRCPPEAANATGAAASTVPPLPSLRFEESQFASLPLQGELLNARVLHADRHSLAGSGNRVCVVIPLLPRDILYIADTLESYYEERANKYSRQAPNRQN